jgi:Zn-dependent protease
LDRLSLFYENYVFGRFFIKDYRFFDTGFERGYFVVLVGEYDRETVEEIKRNKIFEKTFVYEDDGRLAITLIEEKREKFPILNLIMFFLTVLSTLFVGALHLGLNPFGPDILKGWVFSLPLILILGAHEFGHFIVARKYGIPASWPYFIPFPSLIGTMGAVIRLRGFLPSRRALLHMAFAGPIAGFIVAIPILVLGLRMSQVLEGEISEGIFFGEPLIFKFLSLLVLGDVGDKVINLHPLGFAGWVGLFVTALNLIPMGQLDGGHIFYALFPRYHHIIGWLVIVLMVIGGMFWSGWFIWAFFGILVGVYHPPALFMERKLKGIDYIMGFLSLLIFVLCFTPVPIKVQF